MSWRRTTLVAAEEAAIGLLGGLLALLVAGTSTTGVGPFTAELSLSPSLSGGTDVRIPPLGDLELETHAGPVRLDVDVVRLREREAREIVADPDRLVGLGQEVARDLRVGVRRLVLQAGLVTVLGATLLGFLVFRRPAARSTPGPPARLPCSSPRPPRTSRSTRTPSTSRATAACSLLRRRPWATSAPSRAASASTAASSAASPAASASCTPSPATCRPSPPPTTPSGCCTSATCT